MTPISPFTKDDIPQVAEMYQRLLLQDNPSQRGLTSQALPDYFEQILFHNPWYDEELPSLVYRGNSGQIIGFLGVTPRPMLWQGQAIRAAISYHLMVEPESRASLAGVRLLKTFFAGPQDLSLTDGAGDVGRKVWEGVGGATARLYSQRWTRILRPTQLALSRLGRSTPFAPVAQALAPLGTLSDAAIARLLPQFFPPLMSQCSEEELDATTFLCCLPKFVQNRALQPVYDEYSLPWLFQQAAQMSFHGDLKKVQVRDPRGDVIGWYLYYLRPGETSLVLQLAAKKNAFPELLDHLFAHARRHGAAALIGRLEPQYMQELTEKHCFFHRMGSWTLIHSKHPELLHVVQRGDAFLTGLEGEWCLLF